MSAGSSILPVGPKAYTVLDMDEDTIETIEKRMYPRDLSGAGFLKEGEKLGKVCAADWRFLADKNISCEKIACALDAITNLSSRMRVGKFEIREGGIATDRDQECPFGKCHKERGNFKIINHETNNFFTVSKLAIQMIRDHGFFQGHTDYRVDPAQVIRVLGLTSGDADMETRETLHYCAGYFLGDISSDLKEVIKLYAKEREILDDSAEVYFGLPAKDMTPYLFPPEPARKKPRWMEKICKENGKEKDVFNTPAEKNRSDSDQKDRAQFCYILNHQMREATPLTEIQGMEIIPIRYPSLMIYELRKEKVYTGFDHLISKRQSLN